MMSISKLEMALICLFFKRILICSDVSYSVLKVHPHRVTRLTTGPGVYGYLHVIIGLLMSFTN